MFKNRDCGKNEMGMNSMMNTPNMGVGMNMEMSYGGESYPGVVCSPVYECPEEKVCHRYICHEVPHIKPCNTRIINHHVYRHTFTPCYSCCEENVVSNVYDNNCCF